MRECRLKRTNNHGQSLIEVVVIIGVVILLVTGLVVGTTVALRTSRLGRMRSAANKYAQQAMELARNLRDQGWIGFQEMSGLYCLGEDNVFPTSPSDSCTVNMEGVYTRSVVFVWNDPRMRVTATVSWNEGSSAHQSQLVTYFTRWR